MKNCRLIIFDMDGTITQPALDFDVIRAEIGIDGGTILEAIDLMSPAEQVKAFEIIERHERIAAENAELRDGVHEVFDYLHQRDIRVAIATRNSSRSAQTVLRKHSLEVECVVTRDDGQVKPAPEPVLRICRQFALRPDQACVVGDYLYDIQSGQRAGSTTILLLGGQDRPPYAGQADHVIDTLPQLIGLLERNSRGNQNGS